MRLARFALVVLSLLLLTTSMVMAQTTSGSIGGTVTDPNGAVVPGAKIVAVHTPTGREYPAESSAAGVYLFPNLPPGPYEITVTQAGFKKLVRTGIEIRIATRTDLDLALQVGDLAQQIEVKAEAPLLETTKSERGQVISQEVLQSLPIYGGGLRSAEAFIGYMPGVNSSGEMSVNGSNGRARDVLIDGASLIIPESGGTVFNFPGFEAYQEMKLVTSTFNAEYGRLGGGLEIITTKSGTNQVHGSAFLNMRRDIWEAAGWASNQTLGRTPGFRSKVRFNEEGGAAGGPIWIPKVYDGRNKSFFYFSYVKDVRPVTPIITGGETVPTLAMKNGDFSQLAYGIYDPATTATVNGALTRTPFAGNQIPKARWSAISTKIVPVIPDPNSGGGITANYTLVGGSVHDDTIWTLKLDHSFTSNQRVAFFMTRQKQSDLAPSAFVGPLGNGLLSGQYPENYRGNWDWVVSPTMLLHTTYGNSQTIQLWNNPEQNGWGSKFGFPGLTDRADATPVIQFDTDNLTPWGMTQGKVNQGGQFNYTHHFAQQLSWVKGKHEYKVGWELRRLQTVGDDWAGSNGFYYFSRFQTADPTNKNATGNAFASMLLGAIDRGNQTGLPVVIGQIRYGYQGGFWQDDWRVTPRLTLNFGVRYEVPVGWHSKDGLTSNFDPNTPNPGAGGRAGAIVYAGAGPGRAGVKRFYPTDWTDIGPRAGFAYRIGDKTTIRGGFGMFYQTLGNGGCGCTDGVGGAPVSASSDGINPALYWDNGLKPVGVSTAKKPFDPTVDNFQNLSNDFYQGSKYGFAPRIYNWSLTIQREIKRFAVEVAYVGNRGTGLNSSLYINQLNPSYLSLGSLLGKNINDPAVVAAGYKEPFTGFAAGWGGAATLAQALRPFPQYGDVREANSGHGKTWYDSMQAKVERKFGDFQMMGSYVFSKSLSLMTYRQIFSQGANIQTADSFNIADAKSLSPMDLPHVVNILTAYQLPFGKNKKFMGSSNMVMNLLVGGWAISAAQQYRSNGLIQILTPGNPNGSGVLFTPITKANYTGNPIRTNVGVTELDPNNPATRWFNYGAAAPFSSAPAYTFGTTSIYNGLFRNPYWRNENISLQKDFNIWESVKFRYRADFMNAFNRAQLGGINGTIGNANFGRPTGAASGPRYISMGLRLDF
jgi:hypothetical protein